MNYDTPLSPEQLAAPTIAHRPAETASLLALAQQRIEFHQEQIDVIAEGLQQIIESHNLLTLHYQGLIQADLRLVQQLQNYQAGGRMAPENAPLPYAPGNEPIRLFEPGQMARGSEGQMAQTAPPLNGLNGVQAALAASPEDEEAKARLLGHFNTPGDHKPVKDPSPLYNGKTRHQVVSEAAPLPQTTVSVVHYDEGEELPPEALPGHMDARGPMPRTAEQLQAAKAESQRVRGSEGQRAQTAPPSVAQVTVSEAPKGAVVVADDEPPPPATHVVVGDEEPAGRG